MSTLAEIQSAVAKLAPAELAKLQEWLAEYRAELWDRQIEEDFAAGRLDELARAALREHREGRTTPL